MITILLILMSTAFRTQVSNDSDDCYVSKIKNDFSLTAKHARLGYYTAANGGYWGYGFCTRYRNVTIPQGATIDSCWLKTNSYDSHSQTIVNSYIACEDTANATAFSTRADILNRLLTTNQGTYNAVEAMSTNNWYKTPYFANAIQEVVTRTDWTSGNALVVFWNDWDNRSTQAEERERVLSQIANATSKACSLIVWYTIPTEGIKHPLPGVITSRVNQ